MFEISAKGFFEFLGRPFTNPIGWVLIGGVILYIILRLKGKIGGFGGSGGSKGKQQQRSADYVIK